MSTLHWKWEVKQESQTFMKKNHFGEILDFFLWQCPVEGVSKRGFKIQKPYNFFSSVVNILKRQVPALKTAWITKPVAEIESFLREKNVLSEVYKAESFAYHTSYLKNETNSQQPIRGKTKGFFYCIRCAFAHGDFNVRKYNKQNYYQFQNTEFKNGKIKIKGQILLKEEELLEIIKIVKNWTIPQKKQESK